MLRSILSIVLINKRLLIYALIGIISVSIDILVFNLCMSFLKSNYFTANIISVHFGIVNSFILNRFYNFKVKNKTAIRFIAFYLIGILGIAVSSALLFFLVEKLNMNVLYSKLTTIIIVAVIQFILNSKITFKNRSND